MSLFYLLTGFLSGPFHSIIIRTMYLLHNVHYFLPPSNFFPFSVLQRRPGEALKSHIQFLAPYSLWECGKLRDLSECWFFIHLFFNELWRLN